MSSILHGVSLLDILDILVVASIAYFLYRLLRHTKAVPVLIGVLTLFAVALGANLIGLEMISWLFEVFSNYFIIALLITLQPEMRRFLYRIGEATWVRKFYHTSKVDAEAIIQSLIALRAEKVGALMVILNKTGMDQISEAGVPLRAQLSKELLTSIFYGKNPLHDGAVIIKGEEILSASTYLPMSNSSQIKKTHGARHRAGLGISEESDALVIILSEEKIKVSLAFLGNLEEDVSVYTLRFLLSAFNKNILNERWESIFGTRKKRRLGRRRAVTKKKQQRNTDKARV